VSQRLAIIDMGTNTFHLLVAEIHTQGFERLYQERQPVKIGMGGINEGVITEAAMERALKALLNFKQTIKPYQPEKILAFGTSALRNARNGKDFAERMRKETGIECKIISGEEEAKYIFHGVKAAVPLGKEPSLIIDIGGGSVECIIGNADKIFWKRSFEIGAQRLLEKFQEHDPIQDHELKRVEEFFDQSLVLLFKALQEYPAKILVGSSGTFDTLSDIHCIREGILQGANPETPLTLQSFHSIYQELLQKNRAARLQIPGMIEMRVDMIVVACALIHYILNHHQFDKIRVSSYSLKEGVLVSLNS
jgi:Exopolyphosphatase